MASRGRAGSSDQFQTTRLVESTGLVGIDQYLIRAEGEVRIDTLNASPTDNIKIEVRILASGWQLLANHTGAISEKYDVLNWDYIRFTCDTYAGTPFNMYATGFFLIKAEVDTTTLNQEVTQLEILDKLCDLIGQSDDAWHEGNQTVADTGVDKTVFTSTAVPALKSRWVNKVDVTCNRAGKFTIMVGAAIIGSGRTSTGERNKPYIWMPSYKLVSTEVLTVKFEQFNGTNSEVEVYAHGIEE